jgi:hypothetical protein
VAALPASIEAPPTGVSVLLRGRSTARPPQAASTKIASASALPLRVVLTFATIFATPSG